MILELHNLSARGNYRRIKIKCDSCGAPHERDHRHYQAMRARPDGLFDQDYCNTCWRKRLNNSPSHLENLRASMRKLYDCPTKRAEISKKISMSCRGKINLGETNGMKRSETRQKVSATRSSMMKDPTERLKYRQGSIDAHMRGAYIGAKCGQCKWYDYIHSSGKTFKVQGTWELKFIKWLDTNNINFECHAGRIPYLDHEGVPRNYYPDFYLIDTETYVDVKGDFWYNKSKQKFDTIFKQYPDLKLEIYRKAKLQSLGIDI